jgi:hypothetical protein
VPKHVGVELECINNKNPLLHKAFVGLVTYDTTRRSVQPTRLILIIPANCSYWPEQGFLSSFPLLFKVMLHVTLP